MSHLKNLIHDLDQLKLDCEYWDVRIEDSFETAIDMVDGEAVTYTSSPSLGAFLRVRKNGFWIYESTTNISKIKESLVSLAKQNPPPQSPHKYIVTQQAPFIKVSYQATKFSAVSLDTKYNLTKKYYDVLKENKLTGSTNIRYRDIYKVKSFLNSVGTQFEFDFNQGGINLGYTLKDQSNNIFDDRVYFYGSEFKQLENHESLVRQGQKESEMFLTAPAVTPGKYNVLLDPEVTGVFTHESFGHKSEADFMLGDPQALKDWKLGTKIASELLTIVDDGTHEFTSGYCPIDDDGTRAQKNYLIKNGVLTGRLHTVDTAIQLDEKPTGNSRAMNFEFEPMVRMTSTYIEAGTESLASIMKRSEGALLVEGVKHGSGLSTFTIAPTRGYQIGKDGAKFPVRLSVISGSVFETLKNIDAVSADFHLMSSAIGGCGKMGQWPLSVADGGPYVLVKEMQVS